jgi:hypothetical protein
MVSQRRVLVTLGFETNKVPVLLAGSTHIHTCIAGNTALFPSPTVSMPALLGLIQALTTAQDPVATRAMGTASLRNTKVQPLIAALAQTVAYIQGLCDASPTQAVSIIEAAGMKVRAAPAHNKAVLALSTVQPSGTVKAIANVSLLSGKTSKNRQVNWRMSTDGEKTWINLPSTPSGTTLIPNLTPLTIVAVQASTTLTGQPMGPWSPIVTIVVK